MKTPLHLIVSRFLKIVSKPDITCKPFKGFDKILYYERSQHMVFLLHKEIVYETNIWNNIKPYLKKGDLIFDIGGNIGQYALRFSETTGNEGKIISFEPDLKSFAFLQFNININFCQNVICQNIGLADKPSEMEFFRDTETGGRTGAFEKKFVQSNFKGFTNIVKVDTFDNMMSVHGTPDFVKIDVEGFEFVILKNIKEFPRNTIFLVEVREETKNDIFELFSKNNFKCFIADQSEIIEVNKKENIPSFSNLLFKV